MNPLIQKLQDRIQLLDSIKETEKAIWGVMTPQHTIEHLGMVFLGTAMGKGQQLMLPEAQATKMKTRFFETYYPFPKNVSMPGTQGKPAVAYPLRFASFAVAKEKLEGAVEKFITQYQTNPEQKSVHGYFGDLTMEEWLRFHIKHIEHHLMQFGALPPADEKIPQLEKLLYKVYTKVTPDLPAQFGKMNAHQMVEHLGLVFLLSTGKFDLPYKGTLEAAKDYWEDFQAAADPWKTVFPQVQFGEPRPPREKTIAASKVTLKQTFQKYLAYCETNPDSINAHFFLGNLTVDQWRQVHVKHLEHHLIQFGL